MYLNTHIYMYIVNKHPGGGGGYKPGVYITIEPRRVCSPYEVLFTPPPIYTNVIEIYGVAFF